MSGRRERMATIGFRAMARQFPGLVAQAVRLGCEASRWNTIAANLASGIFTGFARLASTSVLQALVAACRRPPAGPGPAWSRRSTGSRRPAGSS